jgi:hypothetical protein
MVWHGGKGHHPRGTATSSYCIKACKNRDIKCNECVRIHGKDTEYEPLTDNDCKC